MGCRVGDVGLDPSFITDIMYDIIQTLQPPYGFMSLVICKLRILNTHLIQWSAKSK